MYFLHHILRSDEKRRALVQFAGLDVKDAAMAVCGESTRLFRQKRHRVSFVEQAQFVVSVIAALRVHVNPAFEHVAMEVGNE